MITKRMKVCIVSGAILGVFCIIGASIRSNFQSNTIYLFSLWYNRLIMGLVIGMAGDSLGWTKVIIRGMLLGLIISFAFYSAIGFSDAVSFLAGILYGIIIEYMAFKYAN